MKGEGRFRKVLNVVVGTYNILHGLNYPLRLATGECMIDLKLVADTVRGTKMEICGLNEVRNQENVEGLCNQAKEIAEQLGYYYVFSKAINYRGGAYGNALISKYPIKSVEHIPIAVPTEQRDPEKRYENRVLLCAELLIGEKTLSVLVTHFGLRTDERELAVKAIRDYAASCPHPLVLMGDFNINSESPQYSALCEFLSDTADKMQGCNFTFPNPTPNRKIDFVFVNDRVKTIAASVPEVFGSDHRPIVATVDI